MLASLLAAGMPLGAQNLGSEYRLKRVIPVEGRQGVAADSNFYYVSGSTALYKYDKQGRLAAKNRAQSRRVQKGQRRECLDVRYPQQYAHKRLRRDRDL